MTILNISNGFGLMGLIRGLAGESVGRTDRSIARPVQLPMRRAQTIAITHVRDVDRFDEGCERWDGLS